MNQYDEVCLKALYSLTYGRQMKRGKPPTELSDQKLYADVKKQVGSNYYNKGQTTAALTRLERKGLLFRERQEKKGEEKEDTKPAAKKTAKGNGAGKAEAALKPKAANTK